MAILNVKDGKAYVGERLGRKGPVSEKVWKEMKKQGLPIGTMGGSPYLETGALDRWMVWRASGAGDTSAPAAPDQPPSKPTNQAPKRKRGRPRKHQEGRR